MSYRYDGYTDTFTHIPDENPITANFPFPKWEVVRQVELSDECIENIADAIAKRLKGTNDE